MILIRKSEDSHVRARHTQTADRMNEIHDNRILIFSAKQEKKTEKKSEHLSTFDDKRARQPLR